MGLRRLRWLAVSAGLLILVLVGLVIVTAVLVQSADRTLHAVQEQNAYNADLPRLRSLLGDLLSAESSQRGYLLTDREVYLQPYLDAAGRLQGEAATLQLAHGEDAKTTRQLARVRELLQLKLADMAEALRLHQQGRHTDALAIVRRDSGQQHMAELRLLLEGVIDHLRGQRDLLGLQIVHEAEQTRWLLLAAVSLLVAFVTSAMFQVVIVLRENGALLRRLDREATHDALTGLPNRRYLSQWLSHCVGMAERGERDLAVLFIDLDGFKHVNDGAGHETGDRVLRGIGTALAQSLRPSDFLCRLGGDEFAVVCVEGVAPESLARLADRLIAEVSRAAQMAAHGSSRVGASIGIARYPTDGDTADALLNAADSAMYEAKARGRGQACFARGTEPQECAA
jgi:diguanylate cyclase (GGDEF)-like protein